MAIPRKPSARLTRHLKLITGQRLLRFSILKETPMAPQAQEWLKVQGAAYSAEVTLVTKAGRCKEKQSMR
jgi:hypothetical protein